MIRLLVVDDVKIGLDATVFQLQKLYPHYEVIGFFEPLVALSFAEKNKIDVAFLDIEMPGISGITVANRLLEMDATTNIIFLTGHTDYMQEAFALFASGYVLKPPSDAVLIQQMQHLRYPLFGEEKLQVFCFNRFRVCYKGKEVSIKRSWSKEMLAYLIDRKGAVVYNSELIEQVMEKNPKDRAQVKKLSVYLKSLMDDLWAAGVEQVVFREFGKLYVDMSKITCDAFEFLNGKTEELNEPIEGYLQEYSWAEETNAYIMEKVHRLKK